MPAPRPADGEATPTGGRPQLDLSATRFQDLRDQRQPYAAALDLVPWLERGEDPEDLVLELGRDTGTVVGHREPGMAWRGRVGNLDCPGTLVVVLDGVHDQVLEDTLELFARCL